MFYLLSLCKDMNSDEALDTIREQLDATVSILPTHPPDNGSLLQKTFRYNINRFFETVANITWRPSSAEVRTTLRSNKDVMLVTPQVVCTARVVQTVPAIHSKLQHFLMGQRGHFQDEDDPLPKMECSLLQITDVFFRGVLNNFLDHSGFTGFIQISQGRVFFDTPRAVWNEMPSPCIVLGMG